MPRGPRVNQSHLIYHVMARGNGRMRIFEDDTDYRHFVTQLGEIVESFEIQCWNYCVMPNHYHTTLQLTLPNLSRAIQCLNTRYAQHWNKRYAGVGHVFQGRFKSQVVQREGYLSCLCRYVARNPSRANLVNAPEDWEWSSYAATVGLRPPPSFVNVSATLSLFGPGDEAVLQARFREFVCGEIDRTIDDRLRSTDPIVGDHQFRVGILPRPAAGSSAAHTSDEPARTSRQ